MHNPDTSADEYANAIKHIYSDVHTNSYPVGHTYSYTKRFYNPYAEHNPVRHAYTYGITLGFSVGVAIGYALAQFYTLGV